MRSELLNPVQTCIPEKAPLGLADPVCFGRPARAERPAGPSLDAYRLLRGAATRLTSDGTTTATKSTPGPRCRTRPRPVPASPPPSFRCFRPSCAAPRIPAPPAGNVPALLTLKCRLAARKVLVIDRIASRVLLVPGAVDAARSRVSQVGQAPQHPSGDCAAAALPRHPFPQSPR